MTAAPQLRLLAVDDDPDVLAFLELSFELDASIDARFASDAASTRAVMASFEPQIVIVDVQLGAEDGILLAAELLESNPALVVLTLSGRIDAGVRRRSLSAGAASVLEKPFDPLALPGIVRELWQEARQRR